MTSPEPDTLAGALERSADALEEAVRAAREVHGQYARLVDAERSWARLDDAIGEQIRRRRTEVGLTGATDLVQSLRHEARHVATRHPEVDRQGRPLPPRPPSEEPEAVRDWWQGLTPGQQEEVLAAEPAWVGRADGLPAGVRHTANLRVLDAEIARRGGADAAHPGPEPQRDAPTVEEVRDLRGLLKLRAFFDEPTDAISVSVPGSVPGATPDAIPGAHERSLYLLDASAYPLKAAIVLGDLDTAQTVVLHVPGTTTTVDLRLEREVTWLGALREEAGRLRGGRERVAVVDWIGYHAPYDVATRRALGDSGMRVLVPGEASDDRYARAAAPDLVRCARGLRAILGPDCRLVASGHSYGASVVGLALARTDAFDAAVVAGCPGLFAASAAELRLPPGALFAAVAPGDLIGFLGVFGPQVLAMEGVRILSPFPRLYTYPALPGSDERPARRVLLRQVWGHESYYHPGSATLLGLAAAAVDAPEAIRTISARWALATWSTWTRRGTPEGHTDDPAAGEGVTGCVAAPELGARAPHEGDR